MEGTDFDKIINYIDLILEELSIDEHDNLGSPFTDESGNMLTIREALGKLQWGMEEIKERWKEPIVDNIEMERLTCTRCGNTYDYEKYGDTPILGLISDKFVIVVDDTNANETVFQCQRCKRLFIAPMGIYIRIVK